MFEQDNRFYEVVTAVVVIGAVSLATLLMSKWRVGGGDGRMAPLPRKPCPNRGLVHTTCQNLIAEDVIDDDSPPSVRRSQAKSRPAEDEEDEDADDETVDSNRIISAIMAARSEADAQKQQEFECRCKRLFLQLERLTRPWAGGSAKIARTDQGSDEGERKEEVGKVVKLIRSLFEDLDVEFSHSRIAHVGALSRCCNVILSLEGLTLLQLALSRDVCRAEAQWAIEKAATAIWAS
eukprot:Polyplicarium_translucidae@DN2186_c0_g1_i1.p1